MKVKKIESIKEITEANNTHESGDENGKDNFGNNFISSIISPLNNDYKIKKSIVIDDTFFNLPDLNKK